MKVTIACISPYIGDDGLGIYMIRTYGRYILWAKKPEEKYSKIAINDATDFETIWLSQSEKKVVPWTIPSNEIANDFMQYANLKNEGGMIITGDDPTEQELFTMYENRTKWLVKSVELGDTIYQRMGGPGVSHIPDYAKRAAAELGEFPEWTFRPSLAKEQCLDCGADVKMLRNGQRPRVCFNCKSPLSGTQVIQPTVEDLIEASMPEAVPVEKKAKKN